MHPRIKERLASNYVDVYLTDRAEATSFITKRLCRVPYKERKEINDAVRTEFERRGFSVIKT